MDKGGLVCWEGWMDLGLGEELGVDVNRIVIVPLVDFTLLLSSLGINP